MELGNLLMGHSRGIHPVDRSYQEEFLRLLEGLGFDSYGQPLSTLLFGWVRTTPHGYTDGTFIVRPYWWGDCSCGALDDEECLPFCSLRAANFVCIPLGFELMWYKYALRDSYSNQKLDSKLLSAIRDITLRRK